MPISSDFTINRSLKTVTHTSGSTIYTVNQLYSYLMDEFDELASLDDTIPMSAQTPTSYSLINGWFIPDASYQFLSGGAITSIGHDAASFTDGIYILSFGSSGYTSAIAGDIGKTVVSSSGSTGILLDYNNTTREWYVRELTGSTWANTNTITITSGTGAGTLNATAVTGESLFSNLYTLGTLVSGTQLYIEQNGAVISTYWSTGQIDLLLKVKKAGTLIDSGFVRVFAREYTDLYDHFSIDLSGGGRNPVPLTTFDDLNNQTSSGTVAGWTDVTITFGTISRDLDNGNGAKNYDVEIDCGSRANLKEVYERLKYVTRRGETATLNSIQGQLYRLANGSYTEVKQSPFGTFAGTTFFGARGIWLKNVPAGDVKNFQLIAADGTTQSPPNTVSVIVNSLIAGDRVAVFKTSSGLINKAQYNLGSGNNTGNTSIVIDSSITADTPKAGVFRIVVDQNTDHRYRYSTWATSTFTLVTIPNGTVTTANGAGTTLINSSATFITSGVLPGDIVHNFTDGSIGYVISVDSETQITHTPLTGGTENDWDSSDAYRINKLVQNYGSTLDGYVPIIDKVSTGSSVTNTLVYSTDIPVLIVVRNSFTVGNKIVPFQVAGTVGSNGLTVSAIRTLDTIVS